jgi:hypothetical protein
MDLLLVLLVAAAFPVGCLFFLLWMARLEDSIPTGVRRASRTPEPAPVLAIPVRRPVGEPPTAAVPAPEPVPAASGVIPAQRSEPRAVALEELPAAPLPGT